MLNYQVFATKSTTNEIKQDRESLSINSNILQWTLMELMREGVLVISRELQPIYMNLKARVICQKFENSGLSKLPPILFHISYHLFKNSSPEDVSFIRDYQINEKQTIRIRACYFSQALCPEFIMFSQEQQYILIFLEDRNATLEEELQIEQKKYALTERETEIWKLLLQAYTYQEIAGTLHISLNTVKFHIKKIYFKRRNCLEHK